MEMFVFLDNVQKTPLMSDGCAHPEYCAETHAGLQPLPCVVLGVGRGQNCVPRGTEVSWLCVGGKRLS